MRPDISVLSRTVAMSRCRAEDRPTGPTCRMFCAQLEQCDTNSEELPKFSGSVQSSAGWDFLNQGNQMNQMFFNVFQMNQIVCEVFEKTWVLPSRGP